MSDTQTAAPVRTPTVYFIDDSATMREVIKIAFRKENIHVITCPDAASALGQFRENPPDAVITDVIMPDRDGYEVCEFVKRQEEFAAIPVILMSGVVNRAVAERAMAVKADELIRKPFQPQDLIIRVKKLLNPNASSVIRGEDPEADPSRDAQRSDSHALSSLFAPSQPSAPSSHAPVLRSESPIAVAPAPPAAPWIAAPVAPVAPPKVTTPPAEVHKLRNEVRRLELLVKKLQGELEAQRQYCTALEAHVKSVQESE
jgi:CheY-like chemotaxis protein